MAFSGRGPILIVEDSADTRYALESILGFEGYWSESTADGHAALAYLADATKPKPVVVLLDLHMPGMDGHVVIKAMKADPRLADIPVVVFTADPGAVPDAAACVRKGSDGPDVLLEAIAACLRA